MNLSFSRSAQRVAGEAGNVYSAGVEAVCWRVFLVFAGDFTSGLPSGCCRKIGDSQAGGSLAVLRQEARFF